MSNVRTEAENLGAKIIAAPNAMYASGFPTEESIKKFVIWLDNNGFSHGNILKCGDTFDIRYEK